MKVEFNPRFRNKTIINNAVYLLDEPGSYLHSEAQKNLCKKIKELSEKDNIIYTTHSLYILDTTNIPINNIKVATKDDNRHIKLVPAYDWNKHIGNKQRKTNKMQFTTQSIKDELKI